MEDLLPCRGPVGEEEVDTVATEIRLSQRGRSPLSDAKESSAVLWVEIGEIRGMGTRHDEHMAGNDRPDIHKHDAPVVFVHHADLDLATNESAEQAVGHRLAVSQESAGSSGRSPATMSASWSSPVMFSGAIEASGARAIVV